MPADPTSIDPDITLAQTPPGSLYADPEVLKLARARVFGPSWQFAGDTDEVSVPGQVRPFTLLEGCLDEPLLFTRDFTDRVHCVSNVCTHRGTILCEKGRAESGGGYEKHLVCRYHGRRFDLDGTCRHMPEFEQVVGFPAASDNLSKVAFETWGKLLFVSLGGATAPSFADVAGPMMQRLAWLSLDQFTFDSSRSRDYLVRANWALYIDNYLEGFHIPFVHAGLNQTLDYGQYAVDLHPWSNLQLGMAKPTGPGSGDPVFDLPAHSPDFGKRIAAYYWWLFPNTMFNFYPWGLSINVVKPLGVESTRVSFLSYVRDASKLDAGAGSGLDRVEREDEAVVEAVQKGLKSRLYTRGRYSPTREQGVHHFHRLLAAALWPV